MRRPWWKLFKRVAELEEEVDELRRDMNDVTRIRVGKPRIFGMLPRKPVNEVLEAVVEALGLEIEVEPLREAKVRVRRREEKECK